MDMHDIWWITKAMIQQVTLFHISPCPAFDITHWGSNKMAAIFQTTFSNGFSWMKMFESLLKFHKHLFLKVQLIRKLVEKMAWHRTGHYLKQWWPRLLTRICVTQSEWVNIFTILITILVLKPDCSGWTRSIPLQLRVDLVLPEFQLPCQWSSRINKDLLSIEDQFQAPVQVLRNDRKMQMCFVSINSAQINNRIRFWLFYLSFFNMGTSWNMHFERSHQIYIFVLYTYTAEPLIFEVMFLS